jgi:phosphoenolpyruvate synthase/pyruvate phosphate dikinase
MTKIGLPVPVGFTISTKACDYYYKSGKKYPPELKKQVVDNVARLERVTKKKLARYQGRGDAHAMGHREGKKNPQQTQNRHLRRARW